MSSRARNVVIALLSATSTLAAAAACGPQPPATKPPVEIPPPVTPLPQAPQISQCDPGNKRIHRLNRVEYDLTLKDLLGVTETPASEFPSDDVGYGFDNNADVLSTSPLLVEKLDAAANSLAATSAPTFAALCTAGDIACAEQTLSTLLKRAYRRPHSADELAGLVTVMNAALADDETFEGAMKQALHALLLSPSFMYRVELDDPASPSATHLLTSYELASRLSYFLWSSMPDDELLIKAADGSLSRPEVFLAEIDRMLASDKSRALSNALAGQWLQGRSLVEARPNAERFPDFNDAIRSSMREETTRFVDEFLRTDDKAVMDMLDADFTFADQALAAWYGLPFDPASADADGFARISLAGSARGGLLTLGSFLTFSSYPLRTSPVKRGKWVLDQLLCMPPDDPPPDIPAFPEDENSGTVRERLEQHRQNPACAGCHDMMDPIGFSLEKFDPVGRFRESDNGEVINDSDEFFTGEIFHGSRELAALMKPLPEVASCTAAQLSTYAIGRGIAQDGEPGDLCTIDDVDARATYEGGSFYDYIRAIVTSDAFQKRRGG